MQGDAMFDTRTKARSAAFLFTGGALVGTLTVVLPHDAAIDEGPVLLLALLALTLAIIFLRAADRITDPLVHLALATATVILSFAVHFTEQTALYALMYTWPALYAFYFFPPRAAVGHMVLIAIAYTTVLATDDTTDATVRIVLVVGTPLVVGLLISRLLSRVRRTMEQSARQERALQTSEQRTRLVVDSARDGFISADAEGRVLDLNAAAERLLGRARADMVGRLFHELAIPAPYRDEFERRRDELIARADQEHGSNVAVRVDVERPDGSQLPAEAMVWAVQRDGGWQFNARLTDIGERLRREQEREQLVRAQAARAEAERATAIIGRLQAVADAALTLRDADELAAEIVVLTRDVLEADLAALLLLQEDGSLQVVRSDDAPGERRRTDIPADEGLTGRVLSTGRPVLLRDLHAEDIADPSILQDGIRSLAGVPLVNHYGEILGVMVVGACAPRELGEGDVDLLRLAADRAALAIDHARAYGREHRIAETLQRSLLPQVLPELPGAVLAARYLPAASEAEIGGDWYDAVPLQDGKVLLVMGDVSGKGLAAASTLGALRNAIRAYALEGHGPADIAERLNRLILADAAREHMTTLVLALFDPVDARLRWVNAGHPPPLAVDAHGRPAFLDGRRSVPLGVLPFPGYEEEDTALEPGSALVLYTDGLVERRGEHLDTGLAVIAEAASDGLLEPEALCERLLAAAVPTGATGDDVAMLVLCHLPLGDRLTLAIPSEPASLAALRTLVRRWLVPAGVGEADVHAIVLACSEVCTNAIEHAGTDRRDLIAFTARVHDGEVEVEVRDRGRWRDETPPGEQGRGLNLIESLMDEVVVEPSEHGTSVRLRRRLREPVQA